MKHKSHYGNFCLFKFGIGIKILLKYLTHFITINQPLYVTAFTVLFFHDTVRNPRWRKKCTKPLAVKKKLKLNRTQCPSCSFYTVASAVGDVRDGAWNKLVFSSVLLIKSVWFETFTVKTRRRGMNEGNFFPWYVSTVNVPSRRSWLVKRPPRTSVPDFHRLSHLSIYAQGPAPRTAPEIFYWGYVLMLSES